MGYAPISCPGRRRALYVLHGMLCIPVALQSRQPRQRPLYMNVKAGPIFYLSGHILGSARYYGSRLACRERFEKCRQMPTVWRKSHDRISKWHLGTTLFRNYVIFSVIQPETGVAKGSKSSFCGHKDLNTLFISRRPNFLLIHVVRCRNYSKRHSSGLTIGGLRHHTVSRQTNDQ